MVEEVLHLLPVRARAELKRHVAFLDTAYLKRTLPDPFACERQWQPERWWRRRLAGGREEK
ncbi:hypothetical protein [Streptomyces collinus]|uniref:hypothetical protein n=1 Tax=Streptomyces collinus TaxID=42684 RepID=UPI0010D0CAF7